MSTVMLDRIREYLSVGGLFNPESVCPQSAVRDLILDCRDEIERLNALINNPHTSNFLEAVRTEAAHQRERWGLEHDATKTDVDWFWLIGYLAGNTLNKPDKKLHHIITIAAACLNWHAAKAGR